MNKYNANFVQVIKQTIEDLKIQKLLLGIVYNMIFLNQVNIVKVSQPQLTLLNILFKSISINPSCTDPDSKEVNEWVHVIIGFILKDDIYNLNESKNILKVPEKYFKPTLLNLLLLNNNDKETPNIFLIELVRDYVDISKTNETLQVDVCMANASILIVLFINTLTEICNILANKDKKISSIDDLVNFKIKDYDNEISLCFRSFLCHVDIVSVLLLNSDFQKLILELCDVDTIINQSIEILKVTDIVYNNRFERFKLNKEKVRNERLSEESILYGFQTNLVKFLANFGLNNEGAKNHFISNKLNFYYVLNHLRIDICNPFKKEWSVLFVKTLTESKSNVK